MRYFLFKSIRVLIFSSLILLSLSNISYSSNLTLPAIAGVPDPDYVDDCTFNTDGTVTGETTVGGCALIFSIPIDSGETLSTVTIYYYDNSGSQFIDVELQRDGLSSDVSTVLDSDLDTSTSASIQNIVLSYGSSTSSSYTYSVIVWFAYDTELRGIKIYYY